MSAQATPAGLITPYYTSPWATLYLGDTRKVAPSLHRWSADVLIADPPYGLKWQSNHRSERFGHLEGDSGSLDWPSILGDVANHLLKQNRHIYVFGYSGEQLKEPLKLGATVPLIWDKELRGLGDLAQPWGATHETVTFGVHVKSNAGRTRGDGRLAARLRQGSVVRAARPGSLSVRHPSEKPVPLLRQFIESSSCVGETVIDPVCGIGSTGVAALLAGRRFIGIEIDSKYAEIAVDRLKKAEHLADQTRGGI